MVDEISENIPSDALATDDVTVGAESSDTAASAESNNTGSAQAGVTVTPLVASVIGEEPVKKMEGMRWFVVHAYSGFELKVRQSLEERIRQHNMQAYFGRVLVPQETVVELVRGQKKTSNRKFWPGYVMVEMIMNQDTWHLVKETPKVTGFLGDASDPEPMPEEEVVRILSQVEGGSSSPRSRASFEQGETVKVVDGPFTDFNGTIEEVRPDKGKVKVLISIFGRATPVELEFFQVEKV